MAKKKPKSASGEDVSKDLWISPRFSLKGEKGARAWGAGQTDNAGSARFLELADIALGVKKAEPRRKRPSGASAHVTSKTEPYTR